MGHKRLIAVLIGLILLFPGTSYALNQWNTDRFVIGQALISMPEIEAYVHSEGGVEINWEQAEISAFLGDKSLSVENVKAFNTQSEGILFILLIDVSTSMSNVQMNATKKALVSLLNSLEEKDRLMLISFGAEVKVLLTGTETKEQSIEKINQLKNNQRGTQLYTALNDAMELAKTQSESFPRRKVAIVISDGVDYSVGEYTVDEITEKLRIENLPVYGLGFSGNKAHLDTLGMLARQSNGQFKLVDRKTLDGTIIDLFAYLRSFYTIRLKAETNIPDNQETPLRLSVSFEGRVYESEIKVSPTKWIPDNIPPTVESVEQLSSATLRILFSEPVRGADMVNNYYISGRDGKGIKINSVSYNSQERQAIVQFDSKLYTGAYQLLFSEVTDDSYERNPLTDVTIFDFQGLPVFYKFLRLIFVDYGWIVLLLGLLVIGLVTYRVLSKRKSIVSVDGKISFGDMVEHKYHIATPETETVTLVVTDVKGASKKIRFDIHQSFFVGRSEINNLYFDDHKMSRQHFVLEVDDKETFITDLGTTNGTFVNGIQAKAKRKLNIGDVIVAGQQRFVFQGIGNGIDR
jgi:Mg-chelatase subunit ChlD